MYNGPSVGVYRNSLLKKFFICGVAIVVPHCIRAGECKQFLAASPVHDGKVCGRAWEGFISSPLPVPRVITAGSALVRS